MAQYIVIGNAFPENVKLETEYKCHKIRKSSGKLSYKITQDVNGLTLIIDNIVAKKRVSSRENVVGTVADTFNLSEVLEILRPNTIASSAKNLLPLLGDNNNSGFVTAVLIDLGLVKEKK